MALTHTLSVYLLKPAILTAAAALKEEVVGELKEHAVVADGRIGTLYVAEGDPSPPDWVRFLADVTEPPTEYRNHSLSGVLLLEASNRWFALTFGHGRRLLNSEAYERDFGLICALNSVDPAKLRGAEARTFDDYALHTLRQLSRLSSLNSLELNTDRELVVSLAGQLEDPRLGKRIDGRDAVRITAEITPSELRSKCSELLRESEKKTYKTRFPFFDTIKRVRDPGDLDRLEKQAMETLGQQRFSEFDLFPPQIVSDEVVAFRFRPSGGRPTRIIEPDSRLLRYAVRGPQSPQAVRVELDRLQLQGIDMNGDIVDEWPFFKCLHWELKDGSAVYVLDGGQWYRIDSSLVGDVEKFAQRIRPSGIKWPAANSNEREDAYNSATAIALGCALLDKRNIRLKGQTAVEPCDLFTAKKQFVHVKKSKGGSKSLSHLFGQAVVSAEGFVLEPEFRSLFSAELEKAMSGFGVHSPAEVAAKDYSIVLGLIGKPKSGNVAETLPFFSKVTLRLAARRLESMGFKVYMDAISLQELIPTGITPEKGKTQGKRRTTGTRRTSAPTPVVPKGKQRP